MTVSGTRALTDLVDSRVGIVRSCTRLPKDWREPALPIIYQATLSNFDYRLPVDTERMASGRGLTDRDSERGAIVEALERYCAALQRPGALVFGTASTLEAPSISPEEFVLYSARQYDSAGLRQRRPVADEQLTWVRGNLLESGEPVYAPASLIYMNFAGSDGRERFTSPNSNGLAGGGDLPSAVLAGIYELVERDSFLISWLTRMTVPRIDFSDATGIATEIRRHYARFGIETLAFDLTTDLGIPVVMAVAFDRSGSLPAATVGLGCDLDPASALDRAVMEVVQVRTGLVSLYRGEQPPARLERYEDVRTLHDHATFAASPEHLAEFDFLLADASPRKLATLADRRRGSVEADLTFCRERLEAAGCTVAFVELTQPELEPFAVRIVRAIASGLQPIHFGFGEERLGGLRLYTVPRLLGQAAQDLTEDDLNPCPHPLA
jgi:ribosomal protein S12 methylthiotransferase accessory factor